MKKITLEEFNAIERDEDGVKHCPTGDYSEIKEFGERCSFGEGCECEFGEFSEMLTAGGFGSCHRTTYFFHLTNGDIYVRCGCFAGSLAEWEQKVKETHGDNKYAKSYLALIPAVKAYFE